MLALSRRQKAAPTRKKNGGMLRVIARAQRTPVREHGRRGDREGIGETPAKSPAVTEPAEAARDPELAVLSALAHGNEPAIGASVVLAALAAAAELDDGGSPGAAPELDPQTRALAAFEKPSASVFPATLAGNVLMGADGLEGRTELAPRLGSPDSMPRSAPEPGSQPEGIVVSWTRDGEVYALLDLPADRSPREFFIERFGLSRAEALVVVLVLQGLDQAAVAVRRGVARSTVRNQLASAYAKLGVASRGELAARHPWLAEPVAAGAD